ncbi:hypothetical protein [Sandaracinus amylolyticus]|uniref:Uncharacterized protein n=1 Tax=Sandaracinus amylolyticus TaxID=927083 RepID=A0A0F6SFL9_9BACT|nr:hypothetical protein [Sandaracinus amylolyticus]AKF07174.1 hypothetical protein DB32_004323 [Sandaracinus amylolyticus]
MSIAIVPHAERWKDAVEAFNRRMRLGGSRWGWYVEPVPAWIAKQRADQPVWMEYWLAVEGDDQVRGGYGLKPQEWRVRGRSLVITDWQGPVSEGAISRKYNSLGLRLVRDMLKKRPLLYSWGHGSDEEPIVQMLRRMGWLMHPTPFALHVVDAYRFLRLNRQLRGTPERRLFLDGLAFTGLGNAALSALQWASSRRSAPVGRPRRKPQVDVVEIDSFGSWADELWHRVKDEYAALAVRDAASLNLLMPPGWTSPEWSPQTRLRVDRGGRTIGWIAVSARQMRDDPRFGELHVGTLVDYFAHPDDAADVVSAGLDHLKARGVDIVIANQSHPAWLRALEEQGFVLVPHRRLFAGSPPLREALAPFEETRNGLFLTNMDGHGPMGL